MLGYRKKSFARAHTMLTTLRTNLDDLGTLKALQQLLLQETIRAEKKIRELKFERKNVVRSGGGRAAKRSSFLENRIEGLRQCAYVWRCFGDAIAFTYMDKFALKQCFFSTESRNAKQGAGFIADKSGLNNEIALLEFVLERNVPAILSDLTNTIRYGDICLMGTSDPYLIEVKSSKKLDHRGKKQKRNLEKLHSFFESDQAALRGFPDVRRQVFEKPERTHISELNACIADSLADGYAVRSPERGLFYIVITGKVKNIGDILSSLHLKDPWMFYLNDFKTNREWAPYLPFILSIEDPDCLYNFIRGNLFILVIVEANSLCLISSDNGYQAIFDADDKDYPMHVSIPGLDGPARISSQFLARIGLEFVSPEWAVLASIEMIKRGVGGIEAEHHDAPPALSGDDVKGFVEGHHRVAEGTNGNADFSNRSPD